MVVVKKSAVILEKAIQLYNSYKVNEILAVSLVISATGFVPFKIIDDL
jgi:hypothetical protein